MLAADVGAAPARRSRALSSGHGATDDIRWCQWGESNRIEPSDSPDTSDAARRPVLRPRRERDL
jgi:hypothetical protein